MENSIRKTSTKTAITVDKIYASEHQKAGTKTAQLRQVVTNKSFYPSKQISNDLQDNVFSLAEFGFQEKEYTQIENRVCWIDVPSIIENPDDVVAKIPANATLYRIMSNHPIISSNQEYAISEGLRTMADYANSQVVRYGDNHPSAGQLILDDNNKPQYRAIFFSASFKDDVDNRTQEAEDFFASAEIKAEMTGSTNVIAGQALV